VYFAVKDEVCLGSIPEKLFIITSKQRAEIEEAYDEVILPLFYMLEKRKISSMQPRNIDGFIDPLFDLLHYLSQSLSENSLSKARGEGYLSVAQREQFTLSVLFLIGRRDVSEMKSTEAYSNFCRELAFYYVHYFCQIGEEFQQKFWASAANILDDVEDELYLYLICSRHVDQIPFKSFKDLVLSGKDILNCPLDKERYDENLPKDSGSANLDSIFRVRRATKLFVQFCEKKAISVENCADENWKELCLGLPSIQFFQTANGLLSMILPVE
jgi:hypothetical protein